jgi:hypothetical protein
VFADLPADDPGCPISSSMRVSSPIAVGDSVPDIIQAAALDRVAAAITDPLSNEDLHARSKPIQID